MASGVSSATLLNLNAEVLKIQESVNKNKAAGRVVVGGIKRPDKVCPPFISVSRQRSESVAYMPHRSRRNG